MKKQKETPPAVVPPGVFSPKYELPGFDPAHFKQGDTVSVTLITPGDFMRCTHTGAEFFIGDESKWFLNQTRNREYIVAQRFPCCCFYGVNTPDGFRCFDVIGTDGFFLPLDTVRTIGMIPVDEVYRGPLVLNDLEYLLKRHPAGLVVQTVNGERVKEVLK